MDKYGQEYGEQDSEIIKQGINHPSGNTYMGNPYLELVA